MAQVNLTLPVSEEQVRALRVGDVVYLTGILFTARDQAHIRMRKMFEKGEAWPFDPTDTAIFHAGPIVEKRDDGYVLKVVGPTSSMRMDPYAKMIGERGVRIVIGKGGMAKEANDCAKEYGYVYLQAAPGCAAFHARNIKKINGVTWPEIGMTESVWELQVENFGPLIVGLDTTGENLHQQIKDRAMEKAHELYP